MVTIHIQFMPNIHASVYISVVNNDTKEKGIYKVYVTKQGLRSVVRRTMQFHIL